MHYTDATGQLTELKQISTWETLKQAAQIRCHDIQNHEVDEETGLPAISYHRKCYQFFTMKSSLDKIEDALKKDCNLLPLTLRTIQIQDLSEGTQNME